MNRIESLVQKSPLDVSQFDPDPRVWLGEQAKEHGFPWLLAFAEDGVIWGRLGESGLELADSTMDSSLPSLQLETLLECRLFGRDGELLLWKDGGEWQARLLQENGRAKALDDHTAGDSETIEYLDEPQVLWGTEVEGNPARKFSRLIERRQNGLRQVVPLSVSAADLEQARLKLTVRHYVDYDERSGEARLALSRLVWLGVEELADQNPRR